MKLNYLDRFPKYNRTSNFMKIRPSWSRVVPSGQTDRQTDRHGKANSLFRNFAKALNKKGTAENLQVPISVKRW